MVNQTRLPPTVLPTNGFGYRWCRRAHLCDVSERGSGTSRDYSKLVRLSAVSAWSVRRYFVHSDSGTAAIDV